MDEEPFQETVSRRIAKVVGVGFAIFCFALALAVSRPRDPAPAPPIDVLAALEQDPDMRELFLALRTEYPADYRALRTTLAAAARQRGTAGAVRDGFLFLQRFAAAKRDAMASAPEAQLVALAEAYLALARLLRDHDVALCAQLSTGFRPGESSPPGALRLVSLVGALQSGRPRPENPASARCGDS